MSDVSPFNLPEEEPRSGFPWLALGVAVVLVVGGIFIWRGNQAEVQREKAAALVAQELNTQKAALDAQRQKVLQITQQLEELQRQSETAKPAARKALISQYNQLARTQNTERDAWQAMATAYNQKIADLQQKAAP